MYGRKHKLVGVTCKDGDEGNTMVMTGSQRRKGRRVITQQRGSGSFAKEDVGERRGKYTREDIAKANGDKDGQ